MSQVGLRKYGARGEDAGPGDDRLQRAPEPILTRRGATGGDQLSDTRGSAQIAWFLDPAPDKTSDPRR